MLIVAPGSGGGRVAESVKARARRASLLKNEDFSHLLGLTSVSDVAVYLSKGAYAPIFKGFEIDRIRRADLEFLLGVSLLAESVAFKHYAGRKDKKFLDLWQEYFDVMLFKNHFRRKMGTPEWDPRLAADRGDDVLDMVGDYQLTLVDKDKLFSADSLNDIIMSVKNAELRAALLEALSGSEDASAVRAPEIQKTGFNVGMALERHYLNNLYAHVAGLGGTEGQWLRVLVGTKVDLINIYWVYRVRRFFNMSPEEALTQILKARYRLDFNILTKAAFAEPDGMKGVLAGTPYAGVFDVDDGNAALRELEIERRIYAFVLAVAERVFLSGTLGFQNVAAYLTLKMLEVRDLIVVTETIRYGLDRSKAGLLLCRSLGKVN